MGKVRICAAQFAVEHEFNKNLSKSEYFMERAQKNKCNVICFPEMFLTGPLSKKDYDGNIPKKAKRTFSEYCKNYIFYRLRTGG